MVDIAGAAGVVCAHGLPVRGCFTLIPTPEQHYYHLLTLLQALKARPDIKDIYNDIACRILSALLLALRDAVEAGSLHEGVLQVRRCKPVAV